MNENMINDTQEIIGVLSETWKGILIAAGISAGIFDALSLNVPINVDELAKKLKFDPIKLENWLYFMVTYGFITLEDNRYKLTDKGNLITEKSPVKELTGLLQLTDFYMNAAMHAKDTFKVYNSLDKISDGKITREYQPRVSDNFSIVLIDMLNKYHINTKDSLLDIGCGSGSFLRMISTKIPEIKLTGMEANLFVIERGKKINSDLGISNRIHLLVGDINEDLGLMQSESFDWVTAINVFHFIPEDKRTAMIENMLRIARKGVLATETICETSPLAGAANVLMFLLWNDFTGFFRQENQKKFNQYLQQKYKNCKIELNEIMQGQSNLLAILKS